MRFLVQLLDRLALRSACRSVWHDLGPQPETIPPAEQLLRSSDLFGDALVAPVEVQPRGTAFHFASPMASRWPENNTVYGKLYRAGPAWTEKPAVILVHGWNGELGYQWQFPGLAWRLVRAGFNVATLELPYHGQRKPRAARATRNFISPDLTHVVEATRQAVCEIRALLRWLAEQTSRAVGLWGVSLGAWLSGLVAGCEQRTGFVVLMSPVVRMDRAIRELPFCEPIRRSLRGAPASMDRLNLSSRLPSCGPENALIIESRYDLFAPPETIEELWQAWRQPEIWRLPHGHISVLMSLGTLERTVRWIRRRAT